MLGNLIFFCISIGTGGVLFLMFTTVRASGLHDRRMTGFDTLCFFVPFWILISAVSSVAAPAFFPAFYILKSVFLNIIPYMSIWFLLHFIESKLVSSRAVKGILTAMPVLSLITLLTNPLHNMHYRNYGNPPEIGPLFMAHMVLTMASLLVMYALLFRYTIKNYRKRPLLIISGLSTVLPIVMYLAYLFTNLISYDITAIGYFFTIVIFIYTSYYKRLRGAKPGHLGEALANIAKSPAISTGVISDAAYLIAKEACLALDTYKVSIWELSEETQILTCIACYNSNTGDYCDSVSLDLNEYPEYKKAITTERLVIINDIHNSKVLSTFTGTHSPEVCSMADAPIRIGSKLVGVLCAVQNYCQAFPVRREWNEQEQAFAASLADLMAIAFTNAQRHELMNRLEDELSEKNEFQRASYSNAPIGLITYSENLTVLECNHAILSLLGVSADYLRKNIKYLSPVYQPDGTVSAEKRESIKKSMLNDEKLTFEWTYQRPDGTPIPCEVTLVSVKQGDGYVLLAYIYDMRKMNAVLQDLRDTSLQLEEALHKANEASKAKTDFLAKMSHEIRTPMNAIIGMTELALREQNPEVKDEHIATVKQAGSNLLAIISDILDFSKIEAGKMEMVDSDYSVSSLVDDTVSIIRMRMVGSHIRFAVMVDSNIPNTLCGDETKIRQAILNILNNAFKYTDKGYVTLSVLGEAVCDNTLNLVFKVTDTGRGIKPRDIDNLFNDFAQFDLESNRGIEGVGLGLAITNSIVSAMGGRIDVESEYGTGSTFTVTIPQVIKTRQVLAKIEQPEDTSVILFERRDVYADSIIYTLENLGISCTLVKTNNALYKMMAERKYSYLFISYTLYLRNEEAVRNLGEDTGIVLLTEFGEAVPYKNLRTLTMPVFCTYVANLINDEHRRPSYVADSESLPDFTAPDARILIVDDILTNIKVVQGLLEPYNMRIDMCTDGLEAVESVSRTLHGDISDRYDLIFMDHKMPRVDGVEATRRIRVLESGKSRNKRVAIIALTANAVAGIREMFMENGFDDYLSKPIDINKLSAVLEKWIPKDKQSINPAR